MEKHSAYVAMICLGFEIPKTWLIPPKAYPDKDGYQLTAHKYYDMFDLPAVTAEQFGYPLYMKPFDGGGWRGVSRIADCRCVDAGLRQLRSVDDAFAGRHRVILMCSCARNWPAGPADAVDDPSQPQARPLP